MDKKFLSFIKLNFIGTDLYERQGKANGIKIKMRIYANKCSCTSGVKR